MKILLRVFLGVLLLLALLSSKTTRVLAAEDYTIESFVSEISIRQDTSIDVKETLKVNFLTPRHGIFRIIPVVYSYKGKTINTRLRVKQITDESGNKYKYEAERLGQSMSLKIGDPDKTVSGPNVYVINYEADNVLQKYGENYEFYWNITGHEWDTTIMSADSIVQSPYAGIVKSDCFAGDFGSSSKLCSFNNNKDNATFISDIPVLPGSDFSVVLAFDGNNNFKEPAFLIKALRILYDNWGYLISPLPLYLILYFWYKRGRDKKFTGENIYYKSADAIEEEKPVFARAHIPLVYHPIDGLTPAEVGTIVDEKVDIEDVVAEIAELARLGFIEIRKLVKKKLVGSDTEYAFIKTVKHDDENERGKLRDYQDYLLREIFRSTIVHKSVSLAEKMFKGDSKELEEARRSLAKREYVLLGGLKNHFYEGLPVFKDKIYERMEKEGIFYSNPEKVRGNWITGYILSIFASFFAVTHFASQTSNYGPVIALILFSIPGIFFAYAMPRRTPKGYSLKRQIEGLSWYLEKGKWRYEIQEKQLFIEEILPLAVALGVVGSLAKDMGELGIKPPSYFAGATTGSFYSDITAFNKTTTNSFLSTPSGKWSGSSSWSGGSGFSGGGSSGGGFGGGGGGSW